MPYNRSNFGVVVHGGKIYTAGGYGNFGSLLRDEAGGGPAECVQADVDVYDPALSATFSLSLFVSPLVWAHCR
jgi:hypothetical protein